jgi:hypothetical protein
MPTGKSAVEIGRAIDQRDVDFGYDQKQVLELHMPGILNMKPSRTIEQKK